MQLAVEQGGAFWVLRAGLDPRFSECRPELLLAKATIRYAAEAGLTRYEFLSSSGCWFEPWPVTERPCAVLCVYPIGVRGLSALVADLGVGLYRRWQGRKA